MYAVSAVTFLQKGIYINMLNHQRELVRINKRIIFILVKKHNVYPNTYVEEKF